MSRASWCIALHLGACVVAVLTLAHPAVAQDVDGASSVDVLVTANLGRLYSTHGFDAGRAVAEEAILGLLRETTPSGRAPLRIDLGGFAAPELATLVLPPFPVETAYTMGAAPLLRDLAFDAIAVGRRDLLLGAGMLDRIADRHPKSSAFANAMRAATGDAATSPSIATVVAERARVLIASDATLPGDERFVFQGGWAPPPPRDELRTTLREIADARCAALAPGVPCLPLLAHDAAMRGVESPASPVSWSGVKFARGGTGAALAHDGDRVTLGDDPLVALLHLARPSPGAPWSVDIARQWSVPWERPVVRFGAAGFSTTAMEQLLGGRLRALSMGRRDLPDADRATFGDQALVLAEVTMQDRDAPPESFRVARLDVVYRHTANPFAIWLIRRTDGFLVRADRDLVQGGVRISGEVLASRLSAAADGAAEESIDDEDLFSGEMAALRRGIRVFLAATE